MKNFYLVALLALFILPGLSFAQQRNCSTMEVLERMLEEHPEMQLNMERIEEFIHEYQISGVEGRAVVAIPVVVHVVYNTSAQNISDAQVQSQIDVLNADFRRLNADADNTWPQAADTQIEFCLASTIRKQTTVSSFGTNDSVKFSSSGGSDVVSPGDYMNMWVCNIGGGILGYAQFPGGDPATDGIVVDYRYFGTTGTATAPFDLGRTATHEVGHYLNLRHIWGDGPCRFDDGVSDTPESDGPNYGCNIGVVNCRSTDMVQNYMDYSDDACMNIFTAGQSTRMNALFAPGGVRASLAASTGCTNPPSSEICDNGIDDDGDGLIDCADSDCSASTACATAEICDNGIDDDLDGFTDCDDSDCSGDPACATSGSCDPPAGLSTNVTKGGREANLSWNAVAGATSYNVILCSPSQASGSCSSVFNTTSTAVTATDLTKGASYEWCVEAVCGGTTSGYVCQSFTAVNGGRLAGPVSELSFFPNPARDLIMVQLDNKVSGARTLSLTDEPTEGTYYISLVDLTGRTVQLVEASYSDSMVEMNVSGVAQGLYLIKVTDAEGNLEQAGKVMIQKD